MGIFQLKTEIIKENPLKKNRVYNYCVHKSYGVWLPL